MMIDRVIGLFAITGAATILVCAYINPITVSLGVAIWLTSWIGVYGIYKIFGGTEM